MILFLRQPGFKKNISGKIMVNIIISSLELHGKPSKKNAEPFGVRKNYYK